MRHIFIAGISLIFLFVAAFATAEVPLSYQYWLGPLAPINPSLISKGGVAIAPMNGYDALFHNPTYLAQDNWNIVPLVIHVWGEDVRNIAAIIQGTIGFTEDTTSSDGDKKKSEDITFSGLGTLRGGASLGLGFSGRGFGIGGRAVVDAAMNREGSLYYLNVEYGMALGYAHRLRLPLGNKTALTVAGTLRPFMRATVAGRTDTTLSENVLQNLILKALRNNGFTDIADLMEDNDITVGKDIAELSVASLYTSDVDKRILQEIGKLSVREIERLSDAIKKANEDFEKLAMAALIFNYIDNTMFSAARGWGIAADVALRLDIRSISITAQFRDFYLPAVLNKTVDNTVLDLVQSYLKTGNLVNTGGTDHVFVRYIPEIRLGLAWHPYLGRHIERYFDVSTYVEFVDPFGLLQKDRSTPLETFLYSMNIGTEILLVKHIALRAGINQGYFSGGVGVDFVVGQLNASVYGIDMGMPFSDSIAFTKQSLGVAVDLHFAFDVRNR